MQNNPENTKPVAMTKTQLAALYNVSYQTFCKWIKPYLEDIGETHGTYLYTPAQVKTIIEKIGEP